MRFYNFSLPEHEKEFDKVEESEDNPLGLVPNATATPESIRDYFSYTVIVTNHKPLSCDEIVKGLSTDRKKLAKAMVEAFGKSKCYAEKSAEKRKAIIDLMNEEPLEQNPGIDI